MAFIFNSESTDSNQSAPRAQSSGSTDSNTTAPAATSIPTTNATNPRPQVHVGRAIPGTKKLRFIR